MAGFLAYIIPVGDSGGHPEHPIAPGGPPPQVWPGPGYPAHPIAPGGSPPGIWGGRPPYVDIGGPPPQPGVWPPPGYPAHPIVMPPPNPPGIWGGAPVPHPEHPIAPVAPDEQPVIEWKTAWSPATGWIIVGIPTVPAPTPSAETTE